MLGGASPSPEAFREESQLSTGVGQQESLKGTLQIEVFFPESFTPHIPIDRRKSVFARITGHRATSSILAATAAFVLHAFLIGAALGGYGHPAEQRPQPLGEVAGLPSTNSEQVLEWVNLDEVSTSKPSRSEVLPVRSAANLLMAKSFRERIEFHEPHFQFPSETDSPASDYPSASADLGDAHQYGIYVGQISARIERAWVRPRTAIGSPLFECRVRIEQDTDGTVEDVAVEECNGGERWQGSLIAAIKTASPLPAPPNPSVFAHTVRMRFEAKAYTAGDPTTEYEPETVQVQVMRAQEEQDTALRHLREALSDPTERVIEIRMVGHANRESVFHLSPPVDPVGAPPRESTDSQANQNE